MKYIYIYYRSLCKRVDRPFLTTYFGGCKNFAKNHKYNYEFYGSRARKVLALLHSVYGGFVRL
jgi:hypothetical protein